jgi:predicted secreted protein
MIHPKRRRRDADQERFEMRTMIRGLGPAGLGVALIAAAAAPGLAAAATLAPTVLHLTQSAERRLPRDRLRVEMRAEKTGGTPQAVEAAINALMAQALPEARRAPGIAVETGSYTVYRATPANRPARWTGRQSLTLTGLEAGPLLALAGRLQQAGLVMSNLSYDLAPQTVRGAEAALTAEALAALQRRATEVAQRLHMTVAGYRDLTVGNAHSGGGPAPRFALARAAMPAPVGAAGEAAVTVTVSADILLAPKRP